MGSALFNPQNSKDIVTMVTDSFIVSMISFISSLAVIHSLPDVTQLYTSILTFGLTFFMQLSYERGIKQLGGSNNGNGESVGNTTQPNTASP